jgi:hypothetical protein
MAKTKALPLVDMRDASLRVSKTLRDTLKAIAAMRGSSLYVLTNEMVEGFVAGLARPDRPRRPRDYSLQSAVVRR